jgi:hypothetical protein
LDDSAVLVHALIELLLKRVLRVRIGDSGHGGIEVVDFKPKEDAVAIALVIGIPDRPVVVFHVKAVQLGDQHAIGDPSLIFPPAVRPRFQRLLTLLLSPSPPATPSGSSEGPARSSEGSRTLVKIPIELDNTFAAHRIGAGELKA